MNLSNIEIFPIPYGTPEWYDFRMTGVGASEIGVLLGLVDKYSSPAQMFHEKVGTVETWKEDNEAMAWGRWSEELIADIWQYWDGDNKSYLKNRNEGNVIRKCRKLTGYAKNKKYPWLFASPDRIINKEGGFCIDTGESLEKEGNLEIKTIEERSAAIWEGGIPPYYIAQINQQMLVLEMDYSELAILENGRRLAVIPLRRNDTLCQAIIETSRNFWEKRVEPAKAAYYKAVQLRKLGKVSEAEKYEAEIQRLEPDPTPGDSYKQFISERYQKTREEIDITSKLRLWGMAHASASEMEKVFTEKKSLAANMIAKEMVKLGVEWAKTPDLGYLRYYKSKGTNVFRVDNRLRLKPDLDIIDSIMSELDVNILKWNPRVETKKNGRKNS